MLADQLDYMIGVDPHRDSHALMRACRARCRRAAQLRRPFRIGPNCPAIVAATTARTSTTHEPLKGG